MKTQKAAFGAGCFWGVEAAFREVKGVVGTAVGYMGGSMENPVYEDVCTDRTGHAEVVEITFDPVVISYEQLLDVFWNTHDPTQLNRQGPDHGTQYRSVIFYHNETQRKAAEQSKRQLQRSERYKNKKIVTAVEPAKAFYHAEEYHQRYIEKHGRNVC